MKQKICGQKYPRTSKMFFIDTNIFLEIELEDKRKEDCELLFRKILNEKEKGLVSDFIVYSILIELTEKSTLKKARGFLNFLDIMKNIEIFIPDKETLFSAMKFVEKYKLDFDDALVVSCMISNKIKKLVSFDKDFDRVKEIKRIEPNQI